MDAGNQCNLRSKEVNTRIQSDMNGEFERRWAVRQDSSADCQPSEDEDKDSVDGPINVIKAECQSKVGECPRNSIEQRLLMQDKSFDLNPSYRCHPLLRSRCLQSLDETDEVRDTDNAEVVKLLDRFRRWFKDRIGGDSTESDSENPPVYDVFIHHRALPGREHFGCCIQSFSATGKQCRYFHVVRHMRSFPKDSLASQLELSEQDEILMINEDVVTLSDTQQVLEKFKYCLKKSGRLTLLIRRIREDNQFEFIEIKAEIEVTDTKIRVSMQETFTRISSGRYVLNRIIDISSRQIDVGGKLISCENGRLVVKKKTNKIQPFSFSVTKIRAWDMKLGNYVTLCVLQEKATEKFLEVYQNEKHGLEVELKPAGGRWTPQSGKLPQKPDARFFCIRGTSASISYLKCALKNKYYLGCDDAGVKLVAADSPGHYRDLIGITAF